MNRKVCVYSEDLLTLTHMQSIILEYFKNSISTECGEISILILSRTPFYTKP